jgi:hypothetical protein
VSMCVCGTMHLDDRAVRWHPPSMVAPRPLPTAESLPFPHRDGMKRPEPKTPMELEKRHRAIAAAVVAVAKMLVPKS